MALCQDLTAMGQHISWGSMPGDPQLHTQIRGTGNLSSWSSKLVNHRGKNTPQELYESHNSSSPAFCLQPQAGRNNLGEVWEQGMQTEPAFAWHLFLACTIQQMWLLSRSSNPDDNANSHWWIHTPEILHLQLFKLWFPQHTLTMNCTSENVLDGKGASFCSIYPVCFSGCP